MAANNKRTLEDFFSLYKKPVEREEYVTDPAKDAEVMKKIHAEDIQASMENAKDTKVSKDSKGNIQVDSGSIVVSAPAPVKKEEAPAPAPVEAPKVVEAPAPAPVEEAPAKPSVREVVERAPEERKPAGFSGWERALIGATPLLVGFLTGNKLEGVQTASKYLVDSEMDLNKRALDLEGKLAEMKAKSEKGVGGTRRFSSQNIVVDEGTGPQNVKASFDTHTGKYFMPDGSEIPSKFIRAAYAVNPEEFDRRTFLKDTVNRDYANYVGTGSYISPTTGLRVMNRNGVEIPVQGQEVGALNPRQEEHRNKLANEFRQNPVVKSVLPVARTAQSIQNLLRSGMPVSQTAAKTLLARMSGEVGNLSEMEQRIYEGSPSIVAKVQRWMSLQATDQPLQPHEVEDLIQIANHYATASRQILNKAANETIRTGLLDFNLPVDTVERAISPIYAPMEEQFEKGAQKAKKPMVNYKGKSYSTPDPSKTIPFRVEGVEGVFWASEKEWERIQKEDPQAKRLKQ